MNVPSSIRRRCVATKPVPDEAVHLRSDVRFVEVSTSPRFEPSFGSGKIEPRPCECTLQSSRRRTYILSTRTHADCGGDHDAESGDEQSTAFGTMWARYSTGRGRTGTRCAEDSSTVEPGTGPTSRLAMEVAERRARPRSSVMPCGVDRDRATCAPGVRACAGPNRGSGGRARGVFVLPWTSLSTSWTRRFAPALTCAMPALLPPCLPPPRHLPIVAAVVRRSRPSLPRPCRRRPSRHSTLLLRRGLLPVALAATLDVWAFVARVSG